MFSKFLFSLLIGLVLAFGFSAPSAMANEATAVGTFTASTTAYNLSLGFTPRYIEVFNLTDLALFKWYKNHGSTKAFKQITDGTISELSSGGFSAYAGSTSAAVGITIGTSIISNGDVCYYMAYR